MHTPHESTCNAQARSTVVAFTLGQELRPYVHPGYNELRAWHMETVLRERLQRVH
jgi:hypothetical protein